MELNTYATHSIIMKSDYVTLTLGIGTCVYISHPIMFRYTCTLLPYTIEIQQDVELYTCRGLSGVRFYLRILCF